MSTRDQRIKTISTAGIGIGAIAALTMPRVFAEADPVWLALATFFLGCGVFLCTALVQMTTPKVVPIILAAIFLGIGVVIVICEAESFGVKQDGKDKTCLNLQKLILDERKAAPRSVEAFKILGCKQQF